LRWSSGICIVTITLIKRIVIVLGLCALLW
jgi:hypothetical protein